MPGKGLLVALEVEGIRVLVIRSFGDKSIISVEV